MAKIVFIDFETTGVNFWQHCIHQVAGIIEIDGKEVERFEWNVKPHPAALIDPVALEVSGLTREDLTGFAYFEQIEVHKSLTDLFAKYVDRYSKTDKFYIAAYNGASFDMPFFRAFFKQCGDNYFGSWFWSVCIDVMVLAGAYLLEERSSMDNFKQATVAKHLGITVDETQLHNACYDVEIMREIYKYITPTT